MTGLSFVMMTWRRGASMLENSLWTLSHQTVPPDEIVLAEVSPEDSWHDETRRVCSQYPLVRLIEGHWSRFNISRGINCSIRATSPASSYVAATCMELLFSENFVEVLLEKVGPRRINFAYCGSLPEGYVPARDRSNWFSDCNAIVPNPPRWSPGAMLCSSRAWWYSIHGCDEARRPYSYPDVDIEDRARRSDLGVDNYHIQWSDAQVLHPYHPLSPLFYTISGYLPDVNGVDNDVVRNPNGWGELEGDEPVRIPGT